MPKRSAKTVSFQAHEHAQDGSGDDGSRAGAKHPVPALRWRLGAVPFHHLVVLAYMVSSGLTADVKGVLLKGLLALLPLQAAYDVVLLHAASARSGNVPLLVASSVFIAGVLGVPVFVVVLTFGAPLATHLSETFLLSLHLAVLVLNPLLVLFKVDFAAFSAVFKATQVYRTILSNPVLAASFTGVVGTWLGVIPIPLDWDRPWQQWPVTLVFGAYLGTTAGGVVSLAVRRPERS